MTLEYCSYSLLCYSRSENIFGYWFSKYVVCDYILIFFRYIMRHTNIFVCVHLMIFAHHCTVILYTNVVCTNVLYTAVFHTSVLYTSVLYTALFYTIVFYTAILYIPIFYTNALYSTVVQIRFDTPDTKY